MTDYGGSGMTFDAFISYSHAADGRLAPAVQRALHRLAKPWHRRRALWIFRDQTGLSVTPGLWSSIQKALDGSEWFVLLASPEAARSAWVNREIEYWIATKPANRILPVVTDGEWRWDPEAGDLTAGSTAVPDALRGVFAEEPLYLDLRWARDDRDLDLRHARFRDAIAELAAPMHGVSKDELESEDVRQHRRVRRLRRVAVAAVALLTMVASGTGVLAGHNADRATAAAVEAQRQQQDAVQQRGNAQRYADEARRQEEHARTQEDRARAATVETERQQKNAREQQAAAERATAEAERQEKNARRQQQLADRARKLAEQQEAVAREQRELAQQSMRETTRQRIIAEQQQRLAEESAAEAERQRHAARQQQRMAEEAAAEARRQKAIAAENERKAKEAAEEARRQEENAAEQKQISIGRTLFNRAKATIGNDPATALRLGIAAERIQPGAETRAELAGLVTSTRWAGTIGEILYAAYGPGDIVALVATDYTASLWSVADRSAPVRLASLAGDMYVGQPAFSPDGKTLVLSGGWDWEPFVFDVSDPAHPRLLSTVPEAFTGWLTFSPDGKTLAAASPDEWWALWDLTDPVRPSRLSKQAGYRAPVTFSPDGRTVVAPGTPGAVWDVTNPAEPAQVAALDGSWSTVTFNPVRPLLTTTDSAGEMSFWHMDNPKKPRKFRTTTGARAYSVEYSRDGRTLASSDREGTARLWDMTDNAPVYMLDLDDHGGSAVDLSFGPDGRTLASTGSVGMLSLWNVEANGAPGLLSRVIGDYESGVGAGLSPDGRRLTTVQFDGMATVWDLSEPAAPVQRATVRLHPSRLDKVVFSPRGDLVAARGWALDDAVTLTDLSDPGAPVPLGVLPAEVADGSMVFAPDGRTLAVSQGFDVVLWDLSDPGTPVRIAALPADDLTSVAAFSPDGRTIAFVVGRKVHVWSLADPANPVRLGTLKGHADAVTTLAFSPDGRTLATGSQDRTAAVWNVAGRIRRQAILTGNGAAVWSVAFAPDGRVLATGTADDAVALWEVAEPAGPVRVATLRRTDLESTSLLFHPDGRTLVTSGTTWGNVRAVVWDYAALTELRADPAAVTCRVTGGGFSAEEWEAEVPETPYRATC